MKFFNSKLSLSLLALIGTGYTSRGATSLRITLSNGEQPTYVLDTHPKLTFDGQDLVITANDAMTSYKRADIVSMQFDDTEDIEDIKMGNNDMALVYNQNIVYAPGRAINVYNTNGIQVATAHEQFHTDKLSSGISLPISNHQTFYRASCLINIEALLIALT